MEVAATALPGVLMLEPRVFTDQRGYFLESYNARRFEELTGLRASFVQDGHSHSTRTVLRGLHYQIRHPQGKLVRVIAGEIFDVIVDISRSSPTFGHWAGIRISAADKRQLWIPPRYAHGFLVLSESAEVFYKMTDYRAPEYERCIRWDDPRLAIEWPLQGSPLLSARDAKGTSLGEAEVFE